MRRLASIALALTLAASAAAQAPEPVAVKPTYTAPVVDSVETPVEEPPPARRPGCWRAQPMPACPGFFLTDIGIETPLYSTRTNDAGRLRGSVPMRLVWSIGFMGTSGRHSHGGAVALTSDDNVRAGTVIEYRYRNWPGGNSAFDAGLGYRRTSVRQGDEMVQARGATLLAGYTPNRWIGVTLRGDVLRARGRSHNALMIGATSTRASEFMFRAVFIEMVRALFGSIGIEWEEEESH